MTQQKGILVRIDAKNMTPEGLILILADLQKKSPNCQITSMSINKPPEPETDYILLADFFPASH